MLKFSFHYRKIICSVIIQLVVLFGSSLVANPEAYAVNSIEDVNREIDSQSAPKVESSGLWLNTIKLLVILGFIIAIAWLIIKFFGKKAQGKMQGNFLFIEDEVMLGQNRGIVLCSAGNAVYALGVTDHSISVLFEIKDEELLKQIENRKTEAPESITMDSKSIIKEYVNKLNRAINKKQLAPSSKNTNENFHKMMQEQLIRLRNIPNESISANKEKGKNNGDMPQ